MANASGKRGEAVPEEVLSSSQWVIEGPWTGGAAEGLVLLAGECSRSRECGNEKGAGALTTPDYY